MKVPFTIYADLESLLGEIYICHNNPEKSSTTKITKHTPSCYSLFTHCSFDRTKNKLDYYSSKTCMKEFCLDLKEHATKIMDYEKKEMISLTKKKRKWTISKKFAIYVNKYLVLVMVKKNFKVKNHGHYTGKYRGAAHDICNLRYKIPQEIPVTFHNGYTYDYYFLTKELAEEFEEGEFECLGKKTEKYITFSVPIKNKITKIDKDGNDKIMNISYKIKFLDSFRLSSSLSVLLIIYLKGFIVISAQIVNLVLNI